MPTKKAAAPAPATRPATIADLKRGDILAFRKSYVDTLPLTNPIRILCEGIALGEGLFDPKVDYVHIAICVGPNGDTIEEQPQGCVEDTQTPDVRWDVIRPNYESDAQIDAVITRVRHSLGDAYNYEGLLVIGLDRLIHSQLANHLPSKIFVCSTLVAHALKASGLDPWPGKNPNDIAPSDYPGAGMTIVIKAGVIAA